MSLELCILASGSSGNCSVVRTPAGAMLIDAGLGPRVTGRRLDGTGVRVADVRAVCLTHLDSDHFSRNWVTTIARRGIRVYCHESRARALVRAATDDVARSELRGRFDELVRPFDGQPFDPLEGVRTRPIALAHDAAGSHGFLFEGYGVRIGYATDLGRVPRELVDCFADRDGLDVLAIESNYDPTMQLQSTRPVFLKQRIMGGRGHLSNQQAFDAVRAILDRCEGRAARLPGHIVLLHRSRECNCPKLLRKMFSQDPRVAARLTLTDQYQRSEWIRPAGAKPRSGEQLVLMFR
jgi:phosphoribosyl 1,2-cyclic phosphodiesterase